MFGGTPSNVSLSFLDEQPVEVVTGVNLPMLIKLATLQEIDSLEELQEKGGNLFTGICLPGSDISDYRVRNLVGVDFDNKLFAINDTLEEGDEIIFCTRNRETAIADMQRMLDNLASRLDSTPKGGIYISCLGRGREQFGEGSVEIRMIHAVLGDFPLTGFFANGEIHHDTLYGYTGVLTIFI